MGEVGHGGGRWRPEDSNDQHKCGGGSRRRNRPGEVRERERGSGVVGRTNPDKGGPTEVLLTATKGHVGVVALRRPQIGYGEGRRWGRKRKGGWASGCYCSIL